MSTNEEEIENDEEEQVIDVYSIHHEIDWLDNDTIQAIESNFEPYSIYLITNDETAYIENGNQVGDQKVMQNVQRMKPEDIIDYTKDPPVIKKEYEDERFTFCDKDGKIKFYGKMDITKDYRDNQEYYALIPSDGCLYENGKIRYKGYFDNGNKTQGIIYNEGYNPKYSIDNAINQKQIILYDYKGSEVNQSHNNGDAIAVIYNGEYVTKRTLDSYVNGYEKDNILLVDTNNIEEVNIDNTPIDEVENLTIKIDNGFRYNFANKNDSFLDEEGNPINYLPEKMEYMRMRIENIISYTVLLLDKYPNLKNIEFQNLNNFGFENKELMNSISNVLSNIATKKNIKIFLSSVGDDSYVKKIEDEYLNDNKQTNVIAQNKEYYFLNGKKKGFKQYANDEDYQQDLENSGFFDNIFDNEVNENEIHVHNVLCDVNYLKFKQEQYNKQNKLNEKKYQELEEENMKLKDLTQLKKTKIEKQRLSEITSTEIFVIILSSIVLPIVGGFVAYYVLRKPKFDITNDKDVYSNNVNQSQSNESQYTETPVEDVEDLSTTIDDSDDKNIEEGYQQNNKQKLNSASINLDNKNNAITDNPTL